MKKIIKIFGGLIVASALLVFFLKLRNEDYNFVLVGKIILAETSDRLVFMNSFLKLIRENIFVLLVLLGLFGLGLVWWLVRHRKGKKWLLTHGLKISTDFIKVYHDQRYYIICSWRDPKTGQGHEFESRAFYTEPKVKETKIAVYVDPDNKKKYFMDTSFLDA